nr:hypothetical protein [Tanacetum cinerariifolium]
MVAVLEFHQVKAVIEFGDSYEVPATVDPNDTNTTSGADAKSGRTVTITTEDMQRKKNDVKARTTLLLSLPDEHQLRFSKYKTAKELGLRFSKHLVHNSGDKDGNTACVSTASTTFPTASASVATINQDTASAYIASQSSGSQVKFKDINQIDEDDIEEIDIKWSMALLSMRADKFWKRTGKRISIQGSDMERGRKENYRQGSKAEEKTPKALMAIDGVGWDWSYMANEGEDHALVVNAEAPTEFTLMSNTEIK